MLYMVIEGFTRGARPVYERATREGRMLPDGLRYLDSWVDERLRRCFQLIYAGASFALTEIGPTPPSLPLR